MAAIAKLPSFTAPYTRILHELTSRPPTAFPHYDTEEIVCVYTHEAGE